MFQVVKHTQIFSIVLLSVILPLHYICPDLCYAVEIDSGYIIESSPESILEFEAPKL